MPELAQVIAERLPYLQTLTEKQAARKPTPEVWSAKEILGHLVDSAGNHRVRWIQMAAQDGVTLPTWDQEQWQELQQWQSHPWAEIVSFWQTYNLHMHHLARQFSPEILVHVARVGTLNEGNPMTLAQLVERYESHLLHHLAQIRERDDA